MNRAFFIVFTCLGLAVISSGQTSRGTVGGLVTDSTDAVLVGAKITLTSDETGIDRTTTTNGEGLYRFEAVDLGTYSVKVEAAGLATVVKQGVTVVANQVARADTKLSPGVQQVSVDVTTEVGTLLQTEAPVRGGNIDEVQINGLPFSTLNPVSLALTLPGVSSNRFGYGETSFAVNGARGRSNNFLINGVENNDITAAGQGFQIRNPDAIKEVSIQTTNFDAEFGRAGGAVVNTITRSGGNAYHGSLSFLYDTTHDDAITNTQALSPEVNDHPPYGTELYLSGTVGGPIVRDRTFFFGAYQNHRQASNATANVVSLSPAGRATLRSLFPTGSRQNVDTYLDLTEGVNAASQFFDTALGSGRPDIQFGTAVTFFPQTFVGQQLQTRLDHKLGNNDLLSGQYLFDDQKFPIGGGALGLPGLSTSAAVRNQNILLAETHVFSSSLTNELRVAYGRLATSLPLDPSNPLGLTVPSIAIAGITNLAGRATNLGIPSSTPQGRIANNYVIQDTVSHVRGSHMLRFGVDLLKQRSRQIAPINERGSLVYQASAPFSSFANFVDDFGGSGGTANRDFGTSSYYPSFFRQAYFFQDRWRVKEALTITLGLRYEDFGNPVNSISTAAFTGLFNINPADRSGPFSLPSKVKDDNNNFGPTVGIAYAPSYSNGFLGRIIGEHKTVIRSGYQISYDSFFNNMASNAAASSPNVVATSTPSTVTAAAPRGLASLAGALPIVPRAVSSFDTQTLVDQNLFNPYYQRWSLGIQRELNPGLVMDLSYVGSKGTGLYLPEDRNPLVPADLRVTPPGYSGAATGRLDNLQGARIIRSNSGSSIYHAGQLQVNRRFNGALMVSGSYAYSKLIDNGSEIFNSAGLVNSVLPIVPHVLGGERNERAVSLFDRTHRGSITYIYSVPFMRNGRGLLGQVAGGWQISGITTFESGVPFTIGNGVDANGVGGNNDRPDFNPLGQPGVRAIPQLEATGAIIGYVNPDANNSPIDPAMASYIGLPAYSAGLANSRRRTGTLGRNTERTRGVSNFDLMILKRISLVESSRLEFRAEFFNIFNHPQFGTGSASPFAPAGTGPSATVLSSPVGTFLNFQNGDGGGRVIRYQVKLTF